MVNNPEAFKAKAAEMQMYRDAYKNPLMFALFTYAEILPVGVFVTIFCAFILRRKHPKQDMQLA